MRHKGTLEIKTEQTEIGIENNENDTANERKVEIRLSRESNKHRGVKKNARTYAFCLFVCLLLFTYFFYSFVAFCSECDAGRFACKTANPYNLWKQKGKTNHWIEMMKKKKKNHLVLNAAITNWITFTITTIQMEYRIAHTHANYPFENFTRSQKLNLKRNERRKTKTEFQNINWIHPQIMAKLNSILELFCVFVTFNYYVFLCRGEEEEEEKKHFCCWSRLKTFSNSSVLFLLLSHSPVCTLRQLIKCIGDVGFEQRDHFAQKFHTQLYFCIIFDVFGSSFLYFLFFFFAVLPRLLFSSWE